VLKKWIFFNTLLCNLLDLPEKPVKVVNFTGKSAQFGIQMKLLKNLNRFFNSLLGYKFLVAT